MILNPDNFKFLRIDIYLDRNQLVITQDGYNSFRFTPLNSVEVKIENFVTFSGTPKSVINSGSNNNRVLTCYDLSDIDFKYINDNIPLVKVGHNGIIPNLPSQLMSVISKHADRIIVTNSELHNKVKQVNGVEYTLFYDKYDDEAYDVTIPDDVEIVDYKEVGIEKYHHGVIAIGDNVKDFINVPKNYVFLKRGTDVSLCIYDADGNSVKFNSGMRTHINDNIMDFRRLGE